MIPVWAIFALTILASANISRGRPPWQPRPTRLSAMRKSRHIPSMPSFVYVLISRNRDGRSTTYVGWTLDLERRLREHTATGGRGAKTTRGRAWLLIYAEKHRTRRGAMAREYALKHDAKFRALLRTQ